MRKSIPLLFVACLFCLMPPQLAATDPTGLADNDFGNNGDSSVPESAYAPGKKERESVSFKKKTHADSQDYYQKGGRQTNRDTACRARLAYKAARYQGPVNGYDEDGEPRAGGGRYGDFPADPQQIVYNIYKFVEDMLYPRKGSDAVFHADESICRAIEKGLFDIGQPYHDPRKGFACIVSAHFFTSLVRELGFPAREKNIYYSVADNEFTTQTAAANVWYGGKWNFYDPWESFVSYSSYLKGSGHGEVRPNMYHDAWIWFRRDPPAIIGGGGVAGLDYKFLLGNPLPTDGGWGNKPRIKIERDGTKIKVDFTQLRLGLKKDGEWYAGTTPSGESVFSPEGVIYIANDDPVPNTRLEPPGPSAFGFELLTLLHGEDEAPGEHGFTVVLSNPGGAAEDYELDIEAMPASREVRLKTVDGETSGSLAPGEFVEIPVIVELGAALELAPAAVTGISGKMVDEDEVALTWEPVQGAAAYRLYRSQVYLEALPDAAAELIAEVGGNGAEVDISEADYINIVAVSDDGLEGPLDPESASVFILDPDLVEGYPYQSAKLLQAFLLMLLLAAILGVAAYIARKA